MGRVATLLSDHGEMAPVGTEDDGDDSEDVDDEEAQYKQQRPSYLNAAGWRACLLSAVGGGFCPVLCLWPTLWPMRRAQRRAIASRYTHYPLTAPTSISSSSSSISISTTSSSWWYPFLCFPCALAEEQTFLEATIATAGTATAAPAAVPMGYMKMRADRVGAASPPPFDPEQGWDMRPIIVDDVAVVEDGGGDGGGLEAGIAK